MNSSRSELPLEPSGDGAGRQERKADDTLASLVAWLSDSGRRQGWDSVPTDPDEPRRQGPAAAEGGRPELPPLAGNEGPIRTVLAHDIWLRRQRGETPVLAEYLRRFPEYEPVLRDLLPPPSGPGGTLDTSPSVPAPDSPTSHPATRKIDGAGGPGTGALSPPPGASPGRTVREGSTDGGPDTVDVAPAWRLGDYEVLGELGRGGMGVVYKARDLRLNRVVALKMILSGGHATEADRARFRGEAEAVARLQHPNVVQIFEVGEYGGLPFFSLEFVEGRGLDRQLAGTPQPAREAAELVVVLARAIHAAHQANIIHRDLKPANILLRRRQGDGRPAGAEAAAVPLSAFEPKITDFGLAKRLDESEGATREGAIMGTPCYMAPEQAGGNVQAVGPATDVYALAAILYELLTGRPPFKGASALNTIWQVLNREPVGVRQLQPSVPRDLETICLKGLQKEPAKRYGSALALAEDLQRFLDGRPILARPAGAWEKAVKWARRRPTQAALAGTALLAVLGVLAGTGFYGLYKDQKAASLQAALDRRDKIDQFRSQAEQAEREGRLGDAKEDWDRALATLDADPGAPQDELRREIVERLEAVNQRLREQQAEAERQIARQKVLEGVARFGKARNTVLFHEVNFTEPDAPANRALLCREAPAALAHLGLRVGTEAADVRAALDPCREHLTTRREFEQLAAGCYEVLLAWAEAEAPPPTAEDASGARRALRLLDVAADLGAAYGLPSPQAYHVRRARYLARAGDAAAAEAERKLAAEAKPTTALDHFLTALDCYRQQPSSSRHTQMVAQAIAAQGLASPIASPGVFPQALVGWKVAALDVSALHLPLTEAACERVLRQEPDHFWAHYLQGLCQLRTRRWADAKVSLTACVGRQPDFPWPQLLRASAHTESGAFATAEADFEEVLRQAKDPLLRTSALINRGGLRVRQKRWDEAVKDLQEAIGLQPGLPQSYVTLASAYQGEQKLDDAVAALDRAIERQPGDPLLHYTRGRLHQDRGAWDAARKDFSRCIELEPRGARSERLASAYVERGRLSHRDGEASLARGDRDSAEDAFFDALADFAGALVAFPDYAPAYRQQAETLLALNRDAEAGEALDRFLARERGTAPIYRARGLIHVRLGEPGRAVEAFTYALHLGQDAATLGFRGWAYLKTGAVQPALEDFEKALAVAPEDSDALCGRGVARVLLGQVPGAVADAELAVKVSPRSPGVLFAAACIHGRVVGRLEARLRGRELPRRQERDLVQQLNVSRTQAVALLGAALRVLPREERRAFWREKVEREVALSPVRRELEQLALSNGW
jgi:tetratricopeptide (TPR) repeat protein